MSAKSTVPTALFAFTLALSISAQRTTPDAFYQAIRSNDMPALRALIASPGTNVRDAGGFTPLMLAAAFGSDEAATALLDAGADVNAARDGMTALHLAWRSEAVVRLLLERGADVQAKTALDATPLLFAASANGTAAVVARLLAAGAEPNAADNRGLTPLIAAARVGNTAAAKLLLDRDANVNAYTSGIGQKTATPLMAAAYNGDIELGRLLLAKNPDLNVKSIDNDAIVKNGPVALGEMTALHFATVAGSAPMVKLLLDAGAAVDPRDVRGLTPLAWAVATDRPQERVIRELLEKGADVSIQSKEGESVRDWARKFNNPAVLPALQLTLSKVPVASSSRPEGGHRPTTREAVERSLPLLHTGAVRVMSDGGCVACHAQPMTAIAADLASRRGWRAEPPVTEVAQVTGNLNTSVATLLEGRESGGLPDTHLYNLFMMAEMNIQPSLATDAFTVYLAAKQRDVGNWHGMNTRPPIQDSDISRTALAIRALTVYGAPARKSEFAGRIDRAAAWLAAQTPLSTEQRVMQLLGLSWANSLVPLKEKRVRELLSLQRADGGWAQTPQLGADAYATGQVLYTLNTLGVAASNPAVQRGVAFLLRTQEEDGTWRVKSRAMKIQPYFESGFPYGHDQWISQTGTAWAVIGLTLSADEKRNLAPIASR